MDGNTPAMSFENADRILGLLNPKPNNIREGEMGSAEAAICKAQVTGMPHPETEEKGIPKGKYDEIDRQGGIVRTLDSVVIYSGEEIIGLDQLIRDPSMCEHVQVFGTVIPPLVFENKHICPVPKGKPRDAKREQVIDLIGTYLGPDPTKFSNPNSDVAVPDYTPDISRERAYEQAQDLLNANPPPLGIGGTKVIAYGDVVAQKNFYNQKHLFPVGFKSERLYTSLDDPNEKALYTSEIIAGDDYENGPLYRVTFEPTGQVFQENSSSAVWLSILKEVNNRRKQLGYVTRGSAISGPEMYGFANDKVAAVLEGLPGVLACDSYVFRAQRPPTGASSGRSRSKASAGAALNMTSATAASAATSPPLSKRQRAKQESAAKEKKVKSMSAKDLELIASAEKQIKELLKKEGKTLKTAIDELDVMQVDVDYLAASGLGRLIARLRKHWEKDIAKSATNLRSKWKETLGDDTSTVMNPKDKSAADEIVIVISQHIGFDEHLPTGIPERALKHKIPNASRMRMLEILHKLDRITFVTPNEIMNVGLGRTIKKIQKHPDPEISQLAGSIKDKWLQLFEQNEKAQYEPQESAAPIEAEDVAVKRKREEAEEAGSDTEMNDAGDVPKSAISNDASTDGIATEDSQRKKMKHDTDVEIADKAYLESKGFEVVARALSKTIQDNRLRIHIAHVKEVHLSVKDAAIFVETEYARYRVVGSHLPVGPSVRFQEKFEIASKLVDTVVQFVSHVTDATVESTLENFVQSNALVEADVLKYFDAILDALSRTQKEDKDVTKVIRGPLATDLTRKSVESVDDATKEYFLRERAKHQEALRERSKSLKQKEMEAQRLEKMKRRAIEEGINLPDDLEVVEEDRARGSDEGLTDIFLDMYQKQQRCTRPVPFVPKFATWCFDPELLVSHKIHIPSCLEGNDFKAYRECNYAGPVPQSPSLHGWIYSSAISLWVACRNIVTVLRNSEQSISGTLLPESFPEFRLSLATNNLDDLHMALLGLIRQEVKDDVNGGDDSGAGVIFGVEESVGVSTRRVGGASSAEVTVEDGGLSSYPYDRDALGAPPEQYVNASSWPENLKRFLQGRLLNLRAASWLQGYAVDEKLNKALDIPVDFLSTCDEILAELMEKPYCSAFSVPVDPVKDNAPKYFEIVKRPMDLGSVQTRLRNGHYDVEKAPEGNRYSQQIDAENPGTVTAEDINADDDADMKDQDGNTGEAEDDNNNNGGDDDAAAPANEIATDADYLRALDERFYEHDSLGGGHEGFAADVRQVWRNCRLFNRSKTRLYGDSKKLERDFKQLYDSRVLDRDPKYYEMPPSKPMTPAGKLVPDIPELEDVVLALCETEYPLLPLSFKIRALMLLVDQCMQTTPMRNMFTERLDTANNLQKERLRILKEEQREEKELQSKSMKLRQHRAKMDQSKEEFETEMHNVLGGLRLDPIGQDRFFNSYWLLSQDLDCASLYVELAETGEWGFFTSSSDIEAFLESLDLRGNRENALHRNLKSRVPTLFASLQAERQFAEETIERYTVLSKGRKAEVDDLVSREVANCKATHDQAVKLLAEAQSLAASWKHATSQDGVVYYFNENTRESTYDYPAPLAQVEELKKKIARCESASRVASAGAESLLESVKKSLVSDSVVHYLLQTKGDGDAEKAYADWLESMNNHGAVHAATNVVALLLSLEQFSLGIKQSQSFAAIPGRWLPSRDGWIARVTEALTTFRVASGDVSDRLRTIVNTLKALTLEYYEEFLGDPYQARSQEAAKVVVLATRHAYRWKRAIHHSSSLAELGLLFAQLIEMFKLSRSSQFSSFYEKQRAELSVGN